MHDTLRDRVRKQEQPGRPRHTASIDSQSVDTSSGGEATGRDNAKNVDGRKRHIIVDSQGLLLAVVVTAADIDDAAAAPEALQQLAKQPLGKVRRVFADSKYHNHALYGWVAENGFYELAIVRRPQGAKGWVQLPIRWTVERTFAWLIKCRRLSVDREKSTRSAEAMIRLAMIHLMLNRLCPKDHQQEFRYRRAA
jgi:putative transposase